MTLLKVFEVHFDESPINRSEVLNRVLFNLFNTEKIQTYKDHPDLKDCEFVLGYFCEKLIREGNFVFARDAFLFEINKCCKDQMIDLETQVVFDTLFANNILVRDGSFFRFRFIYWIYYFAAHRMRDDQGFAKFIFEDRKYARAPEIIEFYTGIDRRREDALEIIYNDLMTCREEVEKKCGLPKDINPYRFAKWTPTPETVERMHREISEGVLESSLPAPIKDHYADQTYDQARPYNQTIRDFLNDQSMVSMMMTMKAGSKALRNSDYVSPPVKRKLLTEILKAWEQATKVMFVLLPTLAKNGYATYDGTGFILAGDFGETPEERARQILTQIPNNIVGWGADDLFSRKMGTLIYDQLERADLSDIERHELILLLIHQRPNGWHPHVQRYIALNQRNSFYLLDVYQTLRAQYRYGFATESMLKDLQRLIMMTATKHVTGDREPSAKAIKKVTFTESPIPPREQL